MCMHRTCVMTCTSSVLICGPYWCASRDQHFPQQGVQGLTLQPHVFMAKQHPGARHLFLAVMKVDVNILLGAPGTQPQFALHRKGPCWDCPHTQGPQVLEARGNRPWAGPPRPLGLLWRAGATQGWGALPGTARVFPKWPLQAPPQWKGSGLLGLRELFTDPSLVAVTDLLRLYQASPAPTHRRLFPMLERQPCFLQGNVLVAPPLSSVSVPDADPLSAACEASLGDPRCPLTALSVSHIYQSSFWLETF